MTTPPNQLGETELISRVEVAGHGRQRRLVILAILGFVALAAGAAAAYLAAVPGVAPDGELSEAAPPPAERQVNVLVVGADTRAEDSGRSDTLMLVSFQPATGAVGVVSIPRDTRVRIPGRRGYDKINTAFAIGGPELAVRTVSEFLDLRVDHYVVVDFAGFEGIVDGLGGVVIDVPKRMYYVDRAQRLVIDLVPGAQRLDGRRALGYVRFRHDRLGDVALVDPNSSQYDGRVERQLQFIRALAKQALRMRNIVRMPALLNQVYSAVATDIPWEKMVSLGWAARKVRPSSVQTYVLPGVGATVRGVSYWLVDVTAARELVAGMSGGSEAEPVRVAVFNGSGVSGAAGKTAARLRQEGYEVVSVGNAGSFSYDHTQVAARDGATDAAAMVAKALGLRTTRVGQATPDIDAEVTVIVGRDLSDALIRSN